MITICYRIISLKFTAWFAAAQVSGQTDGHFRNYRPVPRPAPRGSRRHVTTGSESAGTHRHQETGADTDNQRGSRTEFESGNTMSGKSVRYSKRLRPKACDPAHIRNRISVFPVRRLAPKVATPW